MYIIISLIACKYTKQKTGVCFILARKKYMRILIVAATQPEIEPLFKVGSEQFAAGSLQWAEDGDKLNMINRKPQTKNCILVAGVGMVATAFALGRHLAVNRYDMAINLGIAGSFDRNLALGEVVEVISDSLSEFGAEDNDIFLPIEKLGFGQGRFSASTSLRKIGEQFHIKDKRLKLKKATGITVNTVHGNEDAIDKIKDRLDPQLESMEGAAFFYACRMAGLPCLQIRAVSNYVEKRNRDNWQIGLAIKNLNTFANTLLEALK